MRGLARYALAWIVGAGVLATVLVVLLGGRSEDVSLPPVRETELGEAARHAGCELVRAREGRGLNPPVLGVPRVRPAAPGLYEEAPPAAALVAALRRGVVVVHFRAGLPDELVDRLRELQESVPEGTIVTPNATGMSYELAVTAYGRLLGCRRWVPAVLDAVRLFRGRFIGQGPDRRTDGRDVERDQAVAPSGCTSCAPSANSSTIFAQKAGRSSGLRLVTRPWSVTTSSSTTMPPALAMSVRTLGQAVNVRPRTTSAVTSVHGPRQMAPTGLPVRKNAWTKAMAPWSMRSLSGLIVPPGRMRAS